MSVWSEVRLADRCEIFSGYAFKSSGFTDDENDVALVKGENIGQGEILWDISKRWPREHADDLARYRLETGDVVLAMDRPWVPAGLKVARIGANDPEAYLVQRVARLRARPGLDQNYLYGLVTSRPFVEYVKTIARGVGVPHISAKQIGDCVIRLPSLSVQERIAEILTAYDDLIQNNRRRMALLEDAARQIYREWFVRLRFPGYEHTRIVDGVPEGWRKVGMSTACESLEDGDWIESKDQGGDDFRLLQVSNVGVNEFVETGNLRFVSEETFRRLNCREVLPGQILISRMPKPIGRAWLVTEMPWRLITAVDVAVAVAEPSIADAYFLTYFLNSPETLERCERRSVGATRPRIARRELASLQLQLPPMQLQREFRARVEPLGSQRSNLSKQNDRLRAARDRLLPRLMSGETPV